MDLQQVRDLIDKHEGFRAVAYRDTVGKTTIGFGFNLDDPSAPSLCVVHHLDYEALRSGTPISQADAAAVRDSKIFAAVTTARSHFPNWDRLPNDPQAAVIDMLYEMGPNRFAGFRKFIAAVNGCDYPQAAAQMLDSLWAQEVPARAKEDAGLMGQPIAA